MIIGYMGNKIKKHFGSNFAGKKIRYVYQRKLKGTFHALKMARKILDDNFLILMADDIYSKKDIEKLMNHEQSILVKKISSSVERFGACLIKRGLLRGIVEKQKRAKFKYANCGAYKLTHAIFEEPIIYGSKREELLSSMVGTLGKRTKIRAVLATRWLPIATTNDLKEAEKHLKN